MDIFVSLFLCPVLFQLMDGSQTASYYHYIFHLWFDPWNLWLKNRDFLLTFVSFNFKVVIPFLLGIDAFAGCLVFFSLKKKTTNSLYFILPWDLFIPEDVKWVFLFCNSHLTLTCVKKVKVCDYIELYHFPAKLKNDIFMYQTDSTIFTRWELIRQYVFSTWPLAVLNDLFKALQTLYI